jgi:LPS sulfotransferase NodH
LGTTPNGVFGAKLMWNQLADLHSLATELPELSGLAPHQLLETLFRSPRHVLVSRRDRVRQAVSLWRALQTRAWRLEHPDRQPRADALHYRFEGIRHLAQLLEQEDVEWRRFFREHDIEPFEVVYEEDLGARREHTVRSVLRHIGVEPAPGWRAPERIHRQADELSEAWVAAYHRDAGVPV